jgi:hypothetical protein
MSKPFDPTKPVQTRDGRKARIVCTDSRASDMPIIALAEMGGWAPHLEYAFGCYADGRVSKDRDDDLDLVNIPEKVTGYVNVYRSNGGEAWTGKIYRSRELADLNWDRLRKNRWQMRQGTERLSCLRVDLPEGQFDE